MADADPRLEPDTVARQLLERSLSQRMFDTAAPQLGRFTVLGRAGHGGMGVIYRAWDPTLDREVALKILRARDKDSARDTDDRARLLREARAAARVNHPNVVSVFEVGTEGDEVFIAMEFVVGKTLAAWLVDARRTAREVIDVFLAAGEGLAAAHRAGVVHRDFKPGNVLISGDGRVKVVDFGLARPPVEPTTGGDDVGSTSDGHPSTIGGTPRYASPEQAAGEAVDARSDQYSFCVALAEALGAGVPAKLARLPAFGIRRVAARGLALDPDDRFASMDALLAALRRVRGRRRTIAVAGFVAVSAASVALLWPASDECAGVADGVAASWARAKSDVVAAMGDHGRDASRRLDAYADRWGEAAQSVCRRGFASPEARACLRQRAAELEALLDHLRATTPDRAPRGIDAIETLPRPERCAQEQRLAAEPAVPTDPVQRALYEQYRPRLAEALAQEKLDELDGAIATATEVLDVAKEHDIAALYAEAQLRRGVPLIRAGRFAEAEEALLDAYARAEAVDADTVKLDTLVMLAAVESKKRETDRALERLRLARSVAEHMGEDPEGHAAIGLGEARTLFEGRRFAEAVAAAKRVYDASDPDSADRLYAASLLGISESQLGHDDVALRWSEQALFELGLRVGEEHSMYAGMLSNMATLMRGTGQYAESLPLIEDAVELTEGAVGPTHPDTARALKNLATTLVHVDRPRDAISHFERVLQIYPPGDPLTADALHGYGAALVQVGEFAAAHAALSESLAVYTASKGADAPETLRVRESLEAVSHGSAMAHLPP